MVKFFLATQFPTLNTTAEEYEVIEIQGKQFQQILWGDAGLEGKLTLIDKCYFNKDINLILFEFYLNPIDKLLFKINSKPIDYRAKERSIGVRISITDQNFFNLNGDKKKILLDLMITRTYILADYIKNKKIIFDIESLRSFLIKLKQNFQT